MAPSNQALQAIAHAAEHEKDKHGNDRDRLDLTVFFYEDGSIRIYTSQVGSSTRMCEPLNPLCNATTGSRRLVP
ncbi:MAG: hypothetical protein WBP81_11180 [Solirubrobacteraceae bacterium]